MHLEIETVAFDDKMTIGIISLKNFCVIDGGLA